ncbi:hypothetical protein D3C78_921840 [compost metagenome]
MNTLWQRRMRRQPLCQPYKQARLLTAVQQIILMVNTLIQLLADSQNNETVNCSLCIIREICRHTIACIFTGSGISLADKWEPHRRDNEQLLRNVITFNMSKLMGYYKSKLPLSPAFDQLEQLRIEHDHIASEEA